MDDRRPRFDLYAFALGALALLSLVFFSAHNGAALIMCALVFTGLVAARIADISSRILVPVAFGLVAILWMVWVDPPASAHKTSALAHGAGGVLIGWGVSRYLRTRLAWPLWGLAALATVIGLTVLWEIGEFAGDRVLGTELVPRAADSAEDIFFGTVGAAGGILIAWLLAPQTRTVTRATGTWTPTRSAPTPERPSASRTSR